MIARFVLPILAAGSGLLSAAEPWTVDAILNIPTVADPQIRPDGRSFAYVRRSLDGAAWRNTVYLESIPSGSPRVISTGTRPRSRALIWRSPIFRRAPEAIFTISCG